MFIDKARIFVKAGNGGNGAVSFRREKYVPAGGPDGGDGGRGANIIMVADTGLRTLMDFKYKRKYSAQHGEDGSKKKRAGKNGEDLIFSLLSSEFETVFSKEIREKMVTFKFMEDRGGQLKIHSTISKKARGAFLTTLIENQVQTVEEARRLSFAGFVYREDLSQPQEMVFVKEV